MANSHTGTTSKATPEVPTRRGRNRRFGRRLPTYVTLAALVASGIAVAVTSEAAEGFQYVITVNSRSWTRGLPGPASGHAALINNAAGANMGCDTGRMIVPGDFDPVGYTGPTRGANNLPAAILGNSIAPAAATLLPAGFELYVDGELSLGLEDESLDAIDETLTTDETPVADLAPADEPLQATDDAGEEALDLDYDDAEPLSVEPAAVDAEPTDVETTEDAITGIAPADGYVGIVPFNAVPECTLRAAIELANAMNRPAGQVLIQVHDSINPNAEQRLRGNMVPPGYLQDIMARTAGTSDRAGGRNFWNRRPSQDGGWIADENTSTGSGNTSAGLMRQRVHNTAFWIQQNMLMNNADRGVLQWGEADGANRPALTGFTTATANGGNTSVTNTVARGGGAIFDITAPVTIDLDDRLIPYWGWARVNIRSLTLFHIDSNDVRLWNISQPLSSSTSFLVAPNRSNIEIDGTANDGPRSTALANNGSPERFLVVREGVTNLVVRGYELGGFAAGPGDIRDGTSVTTDGSRATGTWTAEHNLGMIAFENRVPGTGGAARNIAFIDILVTNRAGTQEMTGTAQNTTRPGGGTSGTGGTTGWPGGNGFFGNCSPESSLWDDTPGTPVRGRGYACRPRFLNFVGSGPTNAENVNIENLTFDGLVFRNFNHHHSAMLSFAGTNTLGNISDAAIGTRDRAAAAPAAATAPTITDLTISNSAFLNNVGPRGYDRAAIALPAGPRLNGTTVIESNLIHIAENPPTAPAWTGLTEAATNPHNRAAIHIPAGRHGQVTANAISDSGVFILNNHIDGFNHRYGVVSARQAGTVTMSGNTFSYVNRVRFSPTAPATAAGFPYHGEEFGTGRAAGTAATIANRLSLAGNMVRNHDTDTNRNRTPWHIIGGAPNENNPYASGPRVVTEASEGAFEVIREEAWTQPTCQVELAIRPTSESGEGRNNIAGYMDVSVFWTPTNQAEIYLGTARGVNSPGSAPGPDNPDRALLVVEVPFGAVTNPLAAHFYELGIDMPGRIAGSHTIIGDDDGMIRSGRLRLQTHGHTDYDHYTTIEIDEDGIPVRTSASEMQVESSQYSRVTVLDSQAGICSPELQINQAPIDYPFLQTDPTQVRLLRFILESTMALDAGSVNAGAFDLTYVPVAETIDPTRINPFIMSVSEILSETPCPVFTEDGTPTGEYEYCYDGTRFEVIVSLDDSARVTLNIPPQRVYSAAGIPNAHAATYADNEITFINPLVATPPRLLLIAGDPVAREYSLGLRPGAPVPDADLIFILNPQTGWGAPELIIAPEQPVIAEGTPAGGWSGPVEVWLGEGYAPRLEGRINHILVSADALFHGLVVPWVDLVMFDTDPRIHLTKEVFENVESETSPETVRDTGNLVHAGTHMLYLQRVCFVWTVTNRSGDSWEGEFVSGLNEVIVTDSDVRIGYENGMGHCTEDDQLCTTGYSIIARIPRLVDGATQSFHWCGALIDDDSRPEVVEP